MIRFLTCIALAAAAWLAPAPAKAAETYHTCTGFISSLPATITTQGTWCLNKDMTTSMTSGAAITIATNNVTIDCNHYKIGGLGGGPVTTAWGVHAPERLNATVRHCNIRGFFIGIYMHDGGGHLVERNSLDGNTYMSVWLRSPGSTIRDNLVIDTGGSTAGPDAAYGIVAEYGVDVLDNTVNGVAQSGTDAYAYGIFTFSNGSGSISANRIRGLSSAGSGVLYGIHSIASDGSVLRDNDVQGPGIGIAGGIGIYCNSHTATAVGNVVARFETGIATCFTGPNVVNPN